MRPLANTAAALIAEAGAGSENLTPAQDAAEQRWPGVVVVDVREREGDEMIRNGMIDGAIPVPHGLPEFVADPSQACRNPEPRAAARAILRRAAGDRSELATRTLKDECYSAVAYLDCGMTAWRMQSHPITMV